MTAPAGSKWRGDLLAESFHLLRGGGMVLDLARELSTWLREERIDGRIVGGIAVVLHGYVRTTLDIDLHTRQPDAVMDSLRRHGVTFDPDRREFAGEGIAIPLVLAEQTRPLMHPDIEIDGVRTVDLGDLLTLKLRSGTASLRRTKDLADVVELIQLKGLTRTFASRLGKDQQSAFRQLVRTLESEHQENRGLDSRHGTFS